MLFLHSRIFTKLFLPRMMTRLAGLFLPIGEGALSDDPAELFVEVLRVGYSHPASNFGDEQIARNQQMSREFHPAEE